MKAKVLCVGLMLVSIVFAASGSSVKTESALAQSQTLFYAGKFDKAVAVLEAVLQGEQVPVAADVLRLRLQIGTTKFHKQLVLGSGPGTAIEELVAVVDSAKALGDSTITGDALDALGLALHFKAFEDGNFGAASRAFQEAYALRRKSSDRRRQAESLFHLGLTYEHKPGATPNDKREARALYQKSLAMSRAVGDKLGMSYTYRHLGGLLQEAGKFDAALQLFRKSQALRREMGFVVYLAPATGAIGEVYMDMKEYAEAKNYFKQAYEQARDAGLSRFISSYERRINDAEAKLGVGK